MWLILADVSSHNVRKFLSSLAFVLRNHLKYWWGKQVRETLLQDPRVLGSPRTLLHSWLTVWESLHMYSGFHTAYSCFHTPIPHTPIDWMAASNADWSKNLSLNDGNGTSAKEGQKVEQQQSLALRIPGHVTQSRFFVHQQLNESSVVRSQSIWQLPSKPSLLVKQRHLL